MVCQIYGRIGQQIVSRRSGDGWAVGEGFWPKEIGLFGGG